MPHCWKSHVTAQLFLYLCRFDDASIVYHDEARDGLVKVCRLALYNKYPKYATEGFEALYSRPPVIYLSSAAKPGLSHYLCLQVSSWEPIPKSVFIWHIVVLWYTLLTRSHTFVEIDHEIISTVILLPSAESFKKGCCQLQAKVCARSTG